MLAPPLKLLGGGGGLTVVSYWRKYVHEVLVNRLGGLSLPRKSVVRLTDRPDMILDVYRGRKTTMQQYRLYWEPLGLHIPLELWNSFIRLFFGISNFFPNY